MNMNDQITKMFDKMNVVELVIGIPSQEGSGVPPLFARCRQMIPMGEQGNNFVAQHQSIGTSPADCLQKLCAQVEKAYEVRIEPEPLTVADSVKGSKGKIITMNGDRG